MRKRRTGNGQAVDLEQFMGDLRTMVRDGQELLREAAGTVKAQVVTGAERAGQFVQDNPGKSLGLVFGLGFVAGVLVAGSWCRSKD